MRFVKRKEEKALGAAPLLNVTWDEIREAKEAELEEMEFELWDIMEEAPPSEIDLLMARNIEYVLNREGLLPRDAHVIVPPPYPDWECEGMGRVVSCHYVTGFEIFDKTGFNMLGGGDAYGLMWGYLDERGDVEAFELVDMTVAIPMETVERLKRIVETMEKLKRIERKGKT